MAAVSKLELKRPAWQTIVTLILALWLGSSLILDLIVMPGLYVSGMMTQSGFAAAGAAIFGSFNRLELFCAATVLPGILVMSKGTDAADKRHRNAVILSALLLAVVLLLTYGLTPQMSALGIQLNWFEPAATVPAGMNQLHEGYFGLEALKLAAAGWLLSFCYRS